MAKGDVAITVTLPPETDKIINEMMLSAGVTRKEIIIRAVNLLAKKAKAAK